MTPADPEGGPGRRRHQATVFGEVAEIYDQVRAGYGDETVKRVLSEVPVPLISIRALEVGAGTGKATVAFARHGVDILALEPDGAMAAVARRNCRQYPGTRIEVTTFEDWELQESAFHLVFSAQAWHWVDPAVGYARAAQALVDSGVLALMWHRPRWDPADPVRQDLDTLYREVVPDLHARRPSFPGLEPPPSDKLVPEEMTSSGYFVDVHALTFEWQASFSTDAMVGLLMSQSDHRMLHETQRAALLGGVRQIIDRHGGQAIVPHATIVVIGRRANSPG